MDKAHLPAAVADGKREVPPPEDEGANPAPLKRVRIGSSDEEDAGDDDDPPRNFKAEIEALPSKIKQQAQRVLVAEIAYGKCTVYNLGRIYDASVEGKPTTLGTKTDYMTAIRDKAYARFEAERQKLIDLEDDKWRLPLEWTRAVVRWMEREQRPPLADPSVYPNAAATETRETVDQRVLRLVDTDEHECVVEFGPKPVVPSVSKHDGPKPVVPSVSKHVFYVTWAVDLSRSGRIVKRKKHAYGWARHHVNLSDPESMGLYIPPCWYLWVGGGLREEAHRVLNAKDTLWNELPIDIKDNIMAMLRDDYCYAPRKFADLNVFEQIPLRLTIEPTP